MKSLKIILLFILFFQFGIIFSKTNQKHKLTGKATYYGSQYKETRRTANGERFNKNAYTAAHKTLPFGTKVRVTNKNNGKSVVVRINDRGPFGSGRVIDLTPIAARDLQMTKSGVVSCKIEIISAPKVKKKHTKKKYNKKNRATKK